jgi:hypothetical protein
MIPGWWTEHAVSERLAELRRQVDHQPLVRWGVVGAKRGVSGRCIGMVGWPRIRATRIRLRYRSPWPGSESLTQRADRP